MIKYNFIKQELKRRGITVKETSFIIHKSRGCTSHKLNGKIRFHLEEVQKIADYIDVDISIFVS